MNFTNFKLNSWQYYLFSNLKDLLLLKNLKNDKLKPKLKN